ncbi:hypothetical protein N7454_003262 [Penicillium verhagenii]|nr:hypothetical protein N7454_003262 [Penicillium verhagenii]
MSKDSFLLTLLHMAFAPGLGVDEELFKILLKAGSDPNEKDNDGGTPLHMEARWGFTYGVRLLRLDSQADFNARNKKGNTPFHEAVDIEIGVTDMETIIELRKAGTDLHLVNNNGQFGIFHRKTKKIQTLSACKMRYLVSW